MILVVEILVSRICGSSGTIRAPIFEGSFLR